jgi:hypothetical protein
LELEIENMGAHLNAYTSVCFAEKRRRQRERERERGVEPRALFAAAQSPRKAIIIPPSYQSSRADAGDLSFF